MVTVPSTEDSLRLPVIEPKELDRLRKVVTSDVEPTQEEIAKVIEDLRRVAKRRKAIDELISGQVS